MDGLYEKLCAQHGKEAVDAEIMKHLNHMVSGPGKVTGHCTVIRKADKEKQDGDHASHRQHP